MTLKIEDVVEKQKQIDKMFEEEGLTDEILKKQIELNKKINENDLHDGEYVQ